MVERPDRVGTVLLDHSQYAWDVAAQSAIGELDLAFLPAAGASESEASLIVVNDIPFSPSASPRVSDLFSHRIVMLDPLDPARFPGFEPCIGMDWLWENARGGRMLAFNLHGFVRHFLDGEEERSTVERDAHGRLPLHASSLWKQGVTHLPLLNAYLFAILSVAIARGTSVPAIDPTRHVLPPMLVLSHDCDQLRGNDLITQAVRVKRFLAGLKSGRSWDLAPLRAIWENTIRPRRYFFDDALAMVALENTLGFRSVWYFLNGKGGRLGARSGSRIIKDFARHLPEDHEIGVHYNYGYASDETALRAQIEEVIQLTGRPVKSGRAHYLKFDPTYDYDVLARVGIENDESLGFSSLNSFRVGFAGAYRVPGKSGLDSAVVSIPMHFMDSNTGSHSSKKDSVLSMVQGIEDFGGIVTLLYHPGSYQNPENQETMGLYQGFLEHFSRRGYRSVVPSEIGDLLRHPPS